MDAKDYVFPQHPVDGASSAFGRLLDRISDRIFPLPSPAPASLWTKYGVTFLGSLVWSIYGSFWTFGRVFREIYANISSDIFELPIFWIESIYIIFLGIFIFSIIIVALVGRSFERGRPLTFFLWGLAIPTTALSIVKLAFPDFPIETETVSPQIE